MARAGFLSGVPPTPGTTGTSGSQPQMQGAHTDRPLPLRGACPVHLDSTLLPVLEPCK